MSAADDKAFPIEFDFLERHTAAAAKAAAFTDEFNRSSGEKQPSTVRVFGTLVSLLYRAACCEWGCRGGDHQIEWLAGRVVNHALAGYGLIRAAHYDEALSLTR